MTEWYDRPTDDKTKMIEMLDKVYKLTRKAKHLGCESRSKVETNRMEDYLLTLQAQVYDCIKFARGDNKDG